MDESLINDAKEMLNKLGEKSQSFHGLTREEEIYFEVLLWLFGRGEKPEIE